MEFFVLENFCLYVSTDEQCVFADVCLLFILYGLDILCFSNILSL